MNKAKVTANPGQSTITIERTFDAPREKVFKAMTTKEKIAKWWTGPGYEVTVEEYDAKEGGKWKFVQHKDGQQFSFFGVLHEISPERIVQTFEFDGLPERGHVIMERMQLQEDGDKTHMTVTQAFFSVEDRDGMLASGMEDGMNQTYAVLDTVIAEM